MFLCNATSCKGKRMYNIVRLYFKGGSRIIHRNVSLEEAQTHCHDKETSSSTATNRKSKEITRRMGPWFDSYSAVKVGKKK